MIEGAVLVTGASGFVGQRVVRSLHRDGYRVRTAGRRMLAGEYGEDGVYVPDVNGSTDWRKALNGVNTVIHLAGRAHVLRDDPDRATIENMEINLRGTVALAEQAAAHGVRRFIYISTAKVFGERSAHGSKYGVEDSPDPHGPYALSKYLAEVALWDVFGGDAGTLTIVRPPLVYGPSVRGNFAKIMGLAKTGLPLPFGAIENRRSMVFVDNLADCIVRTIDHPQAAGAVILPADSRPVSTTELLTEIRAAAGQPRRLFPVPTPVSSLVARGLGAEGAASRLLDDFVIDSRETFERLDWLPRVSFRRGIRIALGASPP